MAYNKNSKYLRSSAATNGNTEEEKDVSGKKKQEYRSSVITPKRARELAEAEAKAQEENTSPAEEVNEQKPSETSEPRTPRRTYRRSVITPRTATQTALQDVADDTPPEEAQIAVETAANEKRRGSDADIFKGKADAEKEIFYDMESDQITNKERRGSAIVRMLASMALLTVIAIVLQFLAIRIPFTQNMFTTEFSAVPELVASIAYGPLFGIIICFIKTVVRIIVVPGATISTLTGFVLNSAFLLFASFLYGRMMLTRGKRAAKKNQTIAKHYSALRLLLSSLISAVIAMIPQFFITKYISYPLLDHFQNNGFSAEKMLEVYRTASVGINSFLTNHFGISYVTVNSITDGVLFINLPITFVKLILSAILTAILLQFTIRFLNSVPKDATPKD